MEQEERVKEFAIYLMEKENSHNTITKYLRDVRGLLRHVQEISHESLREYKTFLVKGYAQRSVNSMIAAINQYLEFCQMREYRLKSIRVQKEIFKDPNKDLGKKEYRKLINIALEKKDGRLALIMESICGTGIRIGELEYFTVEGVKAGIIRIFNKGKARVIMIPHKLKMKLLYYAKKRGIRSGVIFITKCGNPMNRSNIWTMMRRLGGIANINPGKIFPSV